MPNDEVEIEKHVLGRRPHHHPMAVALDDGQSFQIAPRQLPMVGYLCYQGFMCLCAAGISWLLFEYGQEQNEPWKHVLIWAITVCTGLLVISIWGWFQDREIRRGPWLIYDREYQQILLPRINEIFPRSETMQLQNVTGYSAADLESTEPQQHSELILITRRGDQFQRWTILASNVTHLAFGKILDPLAEALELPVVRIKQRSPHGEFEVQEYLPRSRRH